MIHRLGLGLLGALVATSVMAVEDPPAGALSCSGCHPIGSSVQTPVPRLTGRNADDLAKAMKAFKTGEAKGTIMDRIAKGFSDDEIQALAEWYARTKPPGAGDGR